MRFPIFDVFMGLWHGVGLSLLAGILHVRLVRATRPGSLRDALAGVLFGSAGFASMAPALDVGLGVVIDLRCLMVGFGTLLGGCWGLIALLPTLAMRAHLGGPQVVPALAGIVAASGIGLVLRRAPALRDRSVPVWMFGLAGAAVGLHVIGSVLAAPSLQGVWIGATIFPAVVPFYLLGGLLIGTVVRWGLRGNPTRRPVTE